MFSDIISKQYNRCFKTIVFKIPSMVENVALINHSRLFLVSKLPMNCKDPALVLKNESSDVCIKNKFVKKLIIH